MKKRGMNMYEIMLKEKKNEQFFKHDFFTTAKPKEGDSVKVVLAHKMIDSLGTEIEIFTNNITGAILKGMLSGRR